MKKIVALLLVLGLLLSGCGQAVPSAPETEQAIPEITEEKDPNVCESADAFIQNMTVGWNLGCSLSVFSKESMEGWGVMAYFLTPDGIYSRSEVMSFDPETLTANISWKLGQDNGVIQAYEGALMDNIGIEVWNFSLGDNDFLTYSVDELKYITADGEVILEEAAGVRQTDMGGGTGGGIVANLEDPAVADILEIHAKVTYIEKSGGEVTDESIAQIETLWGNPVTTPEMIQTVRDRGFNMIRVQVSWLNHMDEEGNIDELWLERVAEVVDYCMDAGVYCLLNTTGAGWLTAERDTFEEQSAVYQRLWEQIATRFADYGELLLFESCNEVLTADGIWWNPPVEAYAVMNDLYQIFVDTVRASGGFNETRNLVLNPYAATFDYNMNSHFELPTDTVENHLIAQVHCYTPNNFTMNETNLGHANFVDEWGTDAEKAELDELMKKVKTRFIDELGIPVIIGEFGVVKRISEAERVEYIDFYAKIAEKYGIKLVIFDDGGDFAVFDRNSLTWPYEDLISALLQENTVAEKAA